MANIMTKRGSLDNIVTYEHYCDTKADLANIPENEITLGSTAIVLQDEDGALGVYIATSDKEWIAMMTTGGSGGSDASAEEQLAALIDGSITNITIPDSVKEIKAHEFRTIFLEYCDCNNVETVGTGAFASCGVALPSQGKYLELKMPNVKTIYGGSSSLATFANCSAKTLDFPMLTVVNEFTIVGCTYLESITLPSVTTINETAIAGCPNLSSVYIGSDCTTIHSAAFADIGTATNLVINCGFAEGAVSGAPWGATDATINYNVPVPEVENE